jgi:DNA-binding FadR family transcriptional regulator
MIEIRRDENNAIDEVLAQNSTVHIERTDDKQWHMQIIDKVDNSILLELYGELKDIQSHEAAGQNDSAYVCPLCDGRNGWHKTGCANWLVNPNA